MSRTLVIGIGNPLRGDDGLGWRAVEALRETASLDEVDTVTCHQLTPDLAEAAARADCVIFVDACVGNPPGKIRVNRLARGRKSEGALTHRFDPQELMRYAQEIYGASPEGWTISMTGARYDYSEGLSAAVESQLPALVDLTRQAALQPDWLGGKSLHNIS